MRKRITFRFIFFTASAFLALNLYFLVFINDQMTSIVDRSQKEIYEEKLENISSMIEREIGLLNKTGMIPVYIDDFQQRTLKSIEQTYYEESQTIIPAVLAIDGTPILIPSRGLWENTSYISTISSSASQVYNGEFDFEFGGDRFWCMGKTVDEWNWTLVYVLPEKVKYADVQTLLNIVIPATIIVSLLVILSISLFLHKNLNPIIRISSAASRIAEGDLDYPLEPMGVYEISTLSRSFIKMREAVRQMIWDLQKSRENLSTILASIGDAVIATDSAGRIALMNPIAEELTGWEYSEKDQLNLNDVVLLSHSNSRVPLSDLFGEIIKYEGIRGDSDIYILTDRKGQSLLISCKGTPIRNESMKDQGVVLIFRDVTEKLKLEDMMIQNEKMLSVGGLAAGMAHEINNPLAGIIQNVNVVANRLIYKVDMPAGRKAAEKAGIDIESIRKFMKLRDIAPMIEIINDSGKRINSIVRDMLNFARKSDNRLVEENIWQLLDKSVSLAGTDYDLKKQYDFKQIKIIREYDKAVPPVLCDGPKIQQVFLNILRNGAYAMQENDTESPCFTLQTALDDTGKFIQINICDNGPGIDEETRARIFEPFFTTKPEGIGTGLGLSVSYFIITEVHNGEMIVSNSSNKGACFTIRLPLFDS